jgi:Bacterial SH3 domain
MTEKTMHLASLVGGAGMLFATAALAASGDALLVTGSNVNVRAGPGTEAGVLIRVGQNEPAIERFRQDDWVEVDLPDQDVRGWIHESLLTETAAAPRQDAPPPAPAVATETGLEPTEVAVTEVPAPESDALRTFRGEVEYLNNRAVAAAGVDLFTGVAPLGEGGVQVVATEAWSTMSGSGQRRYVDALFGRWQAAADGARPLRLEIIDANGVVMMQRSGP